MTLTPNYSATSSPAATTPTADPTAPASSAGSPPTIGSDRLTGILRGADLEGWFPGSDDEATAAIHSVAAYCRDVCPARLECVEDACRLYRLEGRAAEHLGYRRNAASEAAGVAGAEFLTTGT